MYVHGTLAAAGVVLLVVWLVRRAALARAVPVVAALLVAAWAVFLAQGVLRPLGSPTRAVQVAFPSTSPMGGS